MIAGDVKTSWLIAKWATIGLGWLDGVFCRRHPAEALRVRTGRGRA